MTSRTESVCRVVDLGVIPYGDAYAKQKRDVSNLQNGRGDDLLYLLEHPHVITKGRNKNGDGVVADPELVKRRGVEVAETDRGGNVTYHGPGQLVGYPIMRLEGARRDVRRYVNDLETVLIGTLADFGVIADRHPVHRGVWTGGKKIASVGIRIARWVTCHGFALNVTTDLSFFSLITPCGIEGCEMTSMEKVMGAPQDMAAVKRTLASHFSDVFEKTLLFDEPIRAGWLADGGTSHEP